MDFYHYSCYVERIAKPHITNRSEHADACRQLSKFASHVGRLFPFEQHYPISSGYVQVFRAKGYIPRIVGPSCPRTAVNQGEDNALYKSILFTPLRCQGPQHCADALQCAPCLMQTTKSRYLFRTAWLQRRAQIEVLADAASAKADQARRIAVIRDTTLLRAAGHTPATEQHAAEPLTRMNQVLVEILFRQLVEQTPTKVHAGLERIISTTLVLAGVLTPWHEEQLTVAEFTALSARDVLFNLDMSVDAKNMAVAKEAKRKGIKVTIEEVEQAHASKQRPLEFDDPGGIAPEDIDDADRAPVREGSLTVKCSQQSLTAILTRSDEIEDASGRHSRLPDALVRMCEVHKFFAGDLNIFNQTWNIESSRHHSEIAFHTRWEDALQHQNSRAALLREQENIGAPEPDEQGQSSTDPGSPVPPEGSVSIVTQELVDEGPAAVAARLVENASLNDDQKRPVALIARAMQDEWNNTLPDPLTNKRTLPSTHKVVRLLLVGGGGCGKTRIIQKVLTLLFRAFYKNVVKVAPSNKAARLIKGKTMHTASKLVGGGSLKMSALRVNEERRKALACIYSDAGALILDEFSQTQAQLYHALALLTTYGRTDRLQLDPARYALETETFRRIPYVVTAGDELQLPCVPFTASLLASVQDTSSEHRTGVHIFSQQDFVYRLSTAMRYEDEVLKAILAKMRNPAGCTFTKSERERRCYAQMCRPSELQSLAGLSTAPRSTIR